MQSEKLTKKFLMGLPEGVYLISNIYSTEMPKPAFCEKVIAVWARERQWKKIKEAGANGRLCHVFTTKEEVNRWLDYHDLMKWR